MLGGVKKKDKKYIPLSILLLKEWKENKECTLLMLWEWEENKEYTPLMLKEQRVYSTNVQRVKKKDKKYTLLMLKKNKKRTRSIYSTNT